MTPEFFRKPKEICLYDPQYEGLNTPAAMQQFAGEHLAKLDEYITSLGLTISSATLDDIAPIRKLMAELFNAAAQKSVGELYKIIRFGGSGTLALYTAEGEMVGFDLCTCYHGKNRLALGNMVGVSPKMAGKKLGLVLEQYSFLQNMQDDMIVRGGGVKPNNYNSIYMLFNQVGYIGETYLAGQLGSLEPRILLMYPITPAGYYNNRIDLQKVGAFMDAAPEGKEWVTVSCEDFDTVQRMYEETNFRVVAFLPKGVVTEDNRLFALPKGELNFPA